MSKIRPGVCDQYDDVCNGGAHAKVPTDLLKLDDMVKLAEAAIEVKKTKNSFVNEVATMTNKYRNPPYGFSYKDW